MAVCFLVPLKPSFACFSSHPGPLPRSPSDRLASFRLARMRALALDRQPLPDPPPLAQARKCTKIVQRNRARNLSPRTRQPLPVPVARPQHDRIRVRQGGVAKPPQRVVPRQYATIVKNSYGVGRHGSAVGGTSSARMRKYTSTATGSSPVAGSSNSSKSAPWESANKRQAFVLFPCEEERKREPQYPESSNLQSRLQRSLAA